MSTPTPAGSPGALAALAIAGGPRAGEQLPVLRPVATLGRAAGCDLVIDDDSVSARHARLEWEGGGWRIVDLGSLNGTAVEGVTLAPNAAAPLPFGSTVRLGGVRLHFREVAGADPESARAEFVPEAAPATLRQERRGARFPLWLVLVVLILVAVAGYLLTSGVIQLGAAGTAVPGLVAAAPVP